MRKILSLLVVMSLCVCAVAVSQANAECSQNEVFKAYGFYGGERFPQNVALIGPFSSFEECRAAEVKWLQDRRW